MSPASFFGGVGGGGVGSVRHSVHVTDKNTFVLQSCTVPLTVDHGLCSETDVQCLDDSNAVISIKIEQEEPIAVSYSSIKDEPEVSPQIFQQYIGLLSVIMPFHINQLNMVNRNGLYILTECVKFEG
jgi:hypothetical protein